MSGRPWHPALGALAARAAGDRAGTVGWPTTPLAVGWATVELDRAEPEVAESLGGGVRFRPAVGSLLLGASCRVAPPPVKGEPWIVLLEPSTEGRLAASLARHGEGWSAVWFEAAAFARADARDQLSTARPGPLGPERLVLGDAVAGPHRLVVDAATIAPMTDAAVTIRRSTEADAEAIAALFTDEGYPAGPSDIVERLTRFASPHSQVLVAEHEDALLGFIAIHALPRFEHDDRIVRILALVVDAGARDRGIGGALMTEAERIAKELDAAFIEVTAGHHRPEARRLYESLGYDASVTAYLRKKL